MFGKLLGLGALALGAVLPRLFIVVGGVVVVVVVVVGVALLYV